MNAVEKVEPCRSEFIGGSDIAAILGVSRWKSALDVWIEKTGIGQREIITPERAAIFERGKRFEPLLIEMAQEEVGIKVVRCNERYQHEEYPFLSCEIDAETDDGKNVEIKTAHPLLAGDWGAPGTDAAPIYYSAQTMWGLGITKRQDAIIYAAIGFDDRRHYFIERDDETIAAMQAKACAFWNNHVLTRTPPSIDYDHPGVIESLSRLFSGIQKDASIAANDSLKAWRTVFEEAGEQINRYEKIRDGAKAHILMAMGEAEKLLFEDGKEFRRKLVKRKGYAVSDMQYIDFRLANTKG